MTLSDLKPGDYIAYYANKDVRIPTKRKVTSNFGGVMLESSGRNPEEFNQQTGKLIKRVCGNNSSYITVITPAIKKKWKREADIEQIIKLSQSLSASGASYILRKLEETIYLDSITSH